MIFHRLAHAAAAAALLLASPVLAQKTNIGTLSINQPWARATQAKTGAAYLDIRNSGNAADRLLSASSPAAARVELHSMSMDGGVMRMRELKQGIVVPAQGHLRLAPGGLHLMLVGLKAPLEQGGKVPLTLRFAQAGEVQVTAKVAPAGSVAAGGDDHAAH
jgi:copper(I)-binding protein